MHQRNLLVDFPSFKAYQDAPNDALVRQRCETLPRVLLLVSVSQTVEQLQDLRDLEEDKEAQVRAGWSGDADYNILLVLHIFNHSYITCIFESRNIESNQSWLFSVFSCLPGGDLGFGPGRIQSKVWSRRFGCFKVSNCQPYEFWQAILAALPSSELVPAFLPYAVGGGAFTKLLYNME